MTSRIHAGSDVAGLLRNPFMSRGQVIRLLEEIQDFAEQRVEAACKRLGVSLRGLGEAQTDVALLMIAAKLTPSERQACELMNACIAGRGGDRGVYTRDRIILAFNGLADDLKERGRKYGGDQARRRRGKPATDSADAGRNARIRRRHTALVCQGRNDASSQTATEFNLSTRQVRRILQS